MRRLLMGDEWHNGLHYGIYAHRHNVHIGFEDREDLNSVVSEGLCSHNSVLSRDNPQKRKGHITQGPLDTGARTRFAFSAMVTYNVLRITPKSLISAFPQ